jgi:hypothetical protein
MDDLTYRPRPLMQKLRSVGGVLAALTGLVAWGTTFGLLTEQQGAATSATLALVPGVISTIGTLLTSFGVVKSGEKLVTPVSDPQDNAGSRLTASLSGMPKQRPEPDIY